jgi:hypothetical protein
VAQILRSTATATARDRRKIFYRSKHVFSHKKYLNVKISKKFFSFFSSRNQYFPHIPYVTSKKLPSSQRVFNFNLFEIFLNVWSLFSRNFENLKQF